MKLLVYVFGLTLLVFTPHAWATDCGDTTGKDGTRVPCQCGDRVTTNTELQPDDPVVSTDPEDICSKDGLEVDPDVTLDCNRLTLLGGGLGSGIFLNSAGRVTVEKCAVTGFEVGINGDDCVLCTVSENEVGKNTIGILCNRDCILSVFTKNNVFENTGDGMSFNEGSVDNEVTENQVHDNGGNGIVVGEGCVGNVLTNNVTSGNGGEGIKIEEEGNTIVSNGGE